MKKSIVLLGISILITGLLSCNISGITGSKNVIKQDRNITEPFNSINVSEGIEVILENSDVVNVSVEADDNIINLLITEVKDSVLNIYFDDFIGRVQSKKVFIKLNGIKSLTTSSGASIKAINAFSGNDMEFDASSGSDIEIEIESNKLVCTSSSGSDVNVFGTTINLFADASSGSDINAEGLKTDTADVNASSGSNLDIFVNNTLKADASSGADIEYSGHPQSKEIYKSSGGDVRPK
jgi:hypothetical protein